MSTDLATTKAAFDAAAQKNSAEPFTELREALLNNPGGFLKLGVVPASTTCFSNTAELVSFKRAEAIQNANPESRELERKSNNQ
jgi:hypothetical protein